MPLKPSPHFKAVLQALLVTFLWSTSQILVKFGLADIPALTFAGLRYSLAFLTLLPFAIRAGAFRELKGQPRQQWMRLAGLGLLYYAVTQGAIYVSLSYLPVVTLGLAMSFTSILVALLGIAFLGERPTPLQWAGTLLYLAGVFIYFYPAVLPHSARLGLIAAGVGLIANTCFFPDGALSQPGGQLLSINDHRSWNGCRWHPPVGEPVGAAGLPFNDPGPNVQSWPGWRWSTAHSLSPCGTTPCAP